MIILTIITWCNNYSQENNFYNTSLFAITALKIIILYARTVIIIFFVETRKYIVDGKNKYDFNRIINWFFSLSAQVQKTQHEKNYE